MIAVGLHDAFMILALDYPLPGVAKWEDQELARKLGLPSDFYSSDTRSIIRIYPKAIEKRNMILREIGERNFASSLSESVHFCCFAGCKKVRRKQDMIAVCSIHAVCAKHLMPWDEQHHTPNLFSIFNYLDDFRLRAPPNTGEKVVQIAALLNINKYHLLRSVNEKEIFCRAVFANPVIECECCVSSGGDGGYTLLATLADTLFPHQESIPPHQRIPVTIKPSLPSRIRVILDCPDHGELEPVGLNEGAVYDDILNTLCTRLFLEKYDFNWT